MQFSLITTLFGETPRLACVEIKRETYIYKQIYYTNNYIPDASSHGSKYSQHEKSTWLYSTIHVLLIIMSQYLLQLTATQF